MTKEELIIDLRDNVYCRIAASSLHGVGVFAIRDLPKGTNPFQGSGDPEIVAVPAALVFENSEITDEVKALVKDFYAVEKGVIYFSDHGFNRLDISYYMNRSDNPNVEFIAANYTVRTTRDIKKGEELTVDYSRFSEE